MNSSTNEKPNRAERWLTRPRTLWTLFGSALVITLVFPVLAQRLGITFLDGISSPDEARALLASFTEQQRSAHAWATATLDVAYPLAYAGFFAGSALLVFRRFGRSLATVALLAIPVDLLEGAVQVLALTGTADLLGMKAVVTPAKFLLFLVGAGIALVAWSVWLLRWARAGR